ncbi:alanine/glycine:cation symporter family protein [Melioribacter sp. OK-6-Me]|uniref:alanine/glycine:cation symporter family protein n=1 Tax=unclassified Melioribacter TaxID=2627329 RepID=UPI003EDA43B2
MKKSTAGLIGIVIIFTVLLLGGVPFFNSVWTFPGNFETIKNFPSPDVPLGSVPFMLIALLGTGIFITIKLKFPQIRYFWHGIKVTAGIYDDPKDSGDLNHFRALSTAISATVGIGNIAGVATAIYYGGPGALFWMWITGIFGTALKFAEVSLAHKYRDILPNGSIAGGPMYTIEKGLGPKWRWLAIMFACFAVICSFATGNAIQAFTLSDQIYSEVTQIVGVNNFWTVKHKIISGLAISWQQVINGLVLSSIIALVIIGGIKRIGKVTSILSPFMAIFYIIASSVIIIANIESLIPSLKLIIEMAFNPPAKIAGAAGGTFLVMLNTVLWGTKRGLYSNESGQGSAPIAHSTAKTKYGVREGTVALLEPFIDTLTICTLTGLVIVITGAWYHTEFYKLRIDPNYTDQIYNASILTSYAFKIGLSWLFDYGDKIVTLAVLLFATSTIISWSYYGDRATYYLFGDRAILPYKWVFVLFVFIGSIAELEAVWAFGDAALGFMTAPNLLAIILLSGELKKDVQYYFSIKHIPYKKLKEMGKD